MEEQEAVYGPSAMPLCLPPDLPDLTHHTASSTRSSLSSVSEGWWVGPPHLLCLPPHAPTSSPSGTDGRGCDEALLLEALRQKRENTDFFVPYVVKSLPNSLTISIRPMDTLKVYGAIMMSLNRCQRGVVKLPRCRTYWNCMKILERLVDFYVFLVRIIRVILHLPGGCFKDCILV